MHRQTKYVRRLCQHGAMIYACPAITKSVPRLVYSSRRVPIVGTTGRAPEYKSTDYWSDRLKSHWGDTPYSRWTRFLVVNQSPKSTRVTSGGIYAPRKTTTGGIYRRLVHLREAKETFPCEVSRMFMTLDRCFSMRGWGDFGGEVGE